MHYAVTAHTRRCLMFLFLLCLLIPIALGGGCTWLGSVGQSRAIVEAGKDSDAAFYQGQQLYETGQFQQAIAAWENVLPSASRYVDAQMGIREARLQIEQLQQDHRISESVRSKIDIALEEAERLEQRGDLTAAVKKYEEARQLAPQNITLYNKIEELHALLDDSLERSARLGDLYLSQGQYEQSQAEWERLLLLDPDNPKAQQRLADIEVLTATSDTVFVKRGLSLFEKGLVNAAREQFEKARRVNPANELTSTYLAQLDSITYTEHRVKQGETLSSIAVAYSGQSSYFEILADFNTLDASVPLKIGQVMKIPHILDFKRALAPKGTDVLLEAPEEIEETDQTAVRALPVETGSSEARVELEQLLRDGVAAFQDGDYRKAIGALQQVLLEDPENEEAYGYFVQATEYIRRGSRRVERAPADPQPTISDKVETPEKLETPEQPDAQRLADEALALRESGEFKQAIKLFEQAYQLDPSIPGLVGELDETRDALKQQITSYLNEGIKYFNQDSLEEAISAWNKVLELDPANRQAAEYKERAATLLETLSP